MATWSDIRDGTAVGPSAVLEISTGETLVITALWDDECGVGVTVEGSDQVYTLEDIEAMSDAAKRLLSLQPPKQGAPSQWS